MEEESTAFKSLLEALFLPPLKHDLDSIPIQRESFQVYIASVEQNLPLFYDLVQQQKQFVSQNKELESLLLLLLCELTAPDTIFYINNQRLLENAHRLLDNFDLNSEKEELIFEYYRNKLKPDVWKRNLGAVHGFQNFMQHFYNLGNTKRKLKTNWITFCLSVALTLRECHEVTYKQHGINLFLIILKHAQPDEIHNLNVHSVIYDSVFKDVHCLDNVVVTKNIWNCLYTCLDFFENIDSMNWCYVDDLLEILIRNIPLTSNINVSICLIDYVIKLSVFFTLNRKELLSKVDNIVEESTYLEDFRDDCAYNTSYTIFRWSKNILDMIIFECYKLMHDVDTCLKLLKAMHKCFMVAILPIPLTIIEPHLIPFYEKYTAVLMETIVTHKKEKNVIKEVKRIMETFSWQLKRSKGNEKCARLAEFQTAFAELGKQEIFL